MKGKFLTTNYSINLEFASEGCYFKCKVGRKYLIISSGKLLVLQIYFGSKLLLKHITWCRTLTVGVSHSIIRRISLTAFPNEYLEIYILKCY